MKRIDEGRAWMRIHHDLRCRFCQWQGVPLGRRLWPVVLLLFLGASALLVFGGPEISSFLRSPWVFVGMLIFYFGGHHLAVHLTYCQRCGAEDLDRAP